MSGIPRVGRRRRVGVAGRCRLAAAQRLTGTDLHRAVSLAVADIVNAGNPPSAPSKRDIPVQLLSGGAARLGCRRADHGHVRQRRDHHDPAGTGFALTDYGIEVATVADVSVTASNTAVLDVYHRGHDAG